MRFVLTVLVVVAIAAAAALYLGYRPGTLAGQSVMEVATTGDLSDLFATHDAPGSAMADLALRRLENAFYKPVSPQTPIAGEVTALRTPPGRQEGR